MDKNHSYQLARKTYRPLNDTDPPTNTPPANTPPTNTPPTNTPPATPPDVQSKIDAAVKAEAERLRAAYKTELDALQSKAALTAQERDEVARRIEAIGNEKVAKELQLGNELKEVRTKYENLQKESAAETQKWRSQFTDTLRDRELTDAAVAHEAFVPEQVKTILRPATSVEEVLDGAGKSTGKYAVVVEVEHVDPATKKPTTVKLPAKEAVKLFSEKPENFNLFKSKAIGGLGLHPRHSATAPDKVQLAKTSPAEYIEGRMKEEREKHPIKR